MHPSTATIRCNAPTHAYPTVVRLPGLTAMFCFALAGVCTSTMGDEVTAPSPPILVSPVVHPHDELVVEPLSLRLPQPNSSARVVAMLRRDGRFVGQLEKGLEIVSDEPSIATFSAGSVTGLKAGNTTLHFRCGSLSAKLPVEVAASGSGHAPSFRNEVQAVLSKANCNSGACHGALAGKGGFKLSLRGYDDEGDHLFITRHSRGRRVALSEPHKSLVLTKPTLQTTHRGGQRLTIGSEEYNLLANWLASGAPGPSAEDARIQSLQVIPPLASLREGMEVQLIVLGQFSDGSTKDLTSYCKFTSLQASVATVSEGGRVRVVGRGAGVVTAWCLSQNGLFRVFSPFDADVESSLAELRQSKNFIDEHVANSLASLSIPASPRADDTTFLRRAYITAIGKLPTRAEAEAFLADADPLKREKVVDRLLSSAAFVDYWTYKLSDLLLVNSGNLGGTKAMWAYYQWIRDRVAANTPWDVFATELITASGSTMENGAANFFILHNDPRTLAENMSMAFLGMSINCAKCHNHPMEKWTNDQYYGMANMFSRVRRKFDDRTGGTLVYSDSSGELIQPRTGKPQPARPLDAEPVDTNSTNDRRIAVAKWLIQPDNPYFAKAIANRIWANYMGRGLVEPIDDLRATNPASNPELFNALAEHLKSEHYNLRGLMRTIMLSETFQRSSETIAANASDNDQFSHYYPRRMMAEVMLDAFSQVTGAATQFPEYPQGWNAIQLPDSAVNSAFLASFGRPKRELTCSCERESQPSMAQALHLANGTSLNEKLVAENAISRGHSSGADAEHLLNELYWSSLTRSPSAQERENVLKQFAGAKPEEHRSIWEDVYWSVLTSNEFLFNH